ncbi:MAG: HYR domain-containing protein [Lewinellaceae bacterium]|nr:HYR domain-containing protein [Lewinellaceae bacterium]
MRNDLPNNAQQPETPSTTANNLVDPLNSIALPVSDVHGPAVVFEWGGGAIARFFALVCCMLVAGAGFGQKTFNVNSGSWATAGNWTPNGVPAAGDDVIFPSTVTSVTNVPNGSINSVTIQGASGTINIQAASSGNVLTVTTGFSLLAGRTLTIGNSGARLNMAFASTCTATIAGTFTINSGGTARSLTNNGDLTITSTGLVNQNGNSNFILNAGATLRIGSTAGIAATGSTGNVQTTGRTFNAGANYVYNGTANQSTGTGYPTGLTGSLTINNPNTVTIINAARTITTGTLNLVQGTFATTNGSNRLSMGSTAAINRSGGSMTGTLQGTGVYDVTYTGNSKTAGPELNNGGLRHVTVNLTAGQILTLDANRTPDGNLTLTSGTFDLSTFTINRSATGGTLTLSAGTTLVVGGTTGGIGTSNFPNNYATHTIAATSTVEYDGTAAQTIVDEAAPGYGHLTITNNSTKTAANALDIRGNVTINSTATFAGSTFTHNVGGDWTNSGTYTQNTSTVTFNGSALQTLGGSTATTFNNLTVNNTGPGLSLSVNETVAGTLTLTDGLVATNANTLIVSGTGTGAISGGSVASYVNGNLRRGIATGANTYAFPIGTSTAYANASVAFTSASAVGTLTGSTTDGDHPNIGTSTIGASASVNRYWTFTNTGLGTFGYGATFNWVAGDQDGGFMLVDAYAGKYNAPNWTYPTVGTKAGTSLEVTGLSSFSDFQIGGVACTAYDATLSGDATICAGGSTTLTVTPSGGTAPYTVVYTDGMGNTTTASNYPNDPIAVTPSSTRTYTLVSVTDNAGCTASVTGSATVTVNEQATVEIDAPQLTPETCADPTAIVFTANVTPASPNGGAYTYAWTAHGCIDAACPDAGGFDPAGADEQVVSRAFESGTNGGKSVKVVVSTPGCPTSEDILSWNQNPEPSATLTPAPTAVCLGESVELTAGSSSGPEVATYTWLGGDATNPGAAPLDVTVPPANTLIHAPTANPESYYRVVIAYASWGCDDAIADAAVAVSELPDCSITGPSAVCANSTGHQYEGPADMSSYTWTVTDATIIGTNTGQTITVDAGTGTYTVTLTVSDGTCTSTCTQEVTIYPSDNASLTLGDDQCYVGAVTALTGGMPLGGMYSGPGVSFVDPDWLFDADAAGGVGTYTITYTACNLSTDTDEMTVYDDDLVLSVTGPTDPVECQSTAQFNILATSGFTDLTSVEFAVRWNSADWEYVSHDLAMLPNGLSGEANNFPDTEVRVTLTAMDDGITLPDASLLLQLELKALRCNVTAPIEIVPLSLMSIEASTDELALVMVQANGTTVDLVDNVPPSITCPAAVNVSCASEVPDVDINSVTASDNCGQVTVTHTGDQISDQTCPNRYTIEREYTATDDCDNTTTCAQIITVDDETPPTALCQNYTVILDDVTVTVPAENINNGSTDNCNGQLTLSLSPNTFDCSNLGDNTVELTVTDPCDNASTCSAIVTVTLDDNDVTALPTVSLSQSAPVICSGDAYTLTFGGGGNPSGTQYMVTWTIAPTFTTSPPIDPGLVTLEGDFVGVMGMTPTTELDLTGMIDNENVNSIDITFTVTPKYGPCAGEPQSITVTVRPLPQVLGISPTPPAAICSGATVGPFTVNHNIVSGTNNNQIMWEWTGTGIVAGVPNGEDLNGNPTLIVTATTLTNMGATAQTAKLTIVPKRLNANSLLCEGPEYTVEILVEPKPAIVCPDDILATTDGGDCDTTITLTHPGLNYNQTNCPGGSLVIGFAAGTPEPASLPTGGTVSPGGADAFTFNNGQTLVTYTLTDGQGNMTSCTFTVEVTDNDKPTVNCPTPKTVECDQDLTPGPMAPTGEATASDNCPPVAMLTYNDDDISLGNCPQEYVLHRVWTAKDAAGNTSSCTQVINVDDSTPPVISCPKDTVINCNTSTLPAATGTAGAVDNCSAASVSYNDADPVTPGDCPQEFTIKRTWRALDACANAATCLQTITVQDTTRPVINCPLAVTVECNDNLTPGAPGQGFPTGFATATDNCDQTPTLTHGDTKFMIPDTCDQTYFIERIWTATDACGNFRTCVQSIHVHDTTPPVIDPLAADKRVECDGSGNTAELNDWLAANGGAMATDVCGDVTWSNDFEELTGACGATGSAMVTFTATDDCGNESVTTATFTIEDTTAPTIDVEAEDLTVECDGSGNTTELNDWLAANGGATASDVCGGVTWSNDFTGLSDDCGATGSVEVTFTATDDCGNESVTTATFTIEDTTPPSIDVEASDLTVDCDGSGNSTELNAWLTSNGGAMASDICGGVTWSNNFDVLSDGCGATGSVEVTFTATDDCGNESVTTATLTIKDETPPTIGTTASDQTVECDGAGNTAALNDWLVSNGGASATDACSGVTWSNNFVELSDDCGATGSVEVTFAATDACGNTSYTTATFTIEDTTPPTIDTEASDRTVECDGTGNTDALDAWLAANGGAEASDDCSDVTWSNDFVELSDDCGATGSVEVTFTATDDCGLASATTATFKIVDTKNPNLDTPASDLRVECDGAGNTAALNDWLAGNGGASATDDCSGVSWSNNFVELSEDCGATGNATVIFTAMDDCGNAVQTTATFTIEDTTIPDLTCPDDITIECDESTDPANTGMATVSDNCDLSITTSPTDVMVIPTPGCPDGRTIKRVWTAVDACGNETSCEQIITVQDKTPPVFVFCPPATTVDCQLGPDPSPTVTGLAVATDNCDTQPAVAYINTSTQTNNGTCTDYSYVITRRWLTVDNCGNTKTCTQLITVQDITDPVITCPMNVEVECDESSEPPATGEASATDNCDQAIVISHDDVVDPGDCIFEKTITRTWTATDACGNTDACVQTISVVDSTDPEFTFCPKDTVINCEFDPVPAITGQATATDNCDPAPQVVFDDDEPVVNPDCPQGYSFVRTWFAVDVCNRFSTCEQKITVQDTTAPKMMCPMDLTIECDQNPDPVLTGEPFDLSDNCDPGPLTVTYTDGPPGQGDCANGALILRTWMVEDACGNTFTCVQRIGVDDTEPPVISCPSNATVECDESSEPDALGSASAEDNCDMDPVIDYSDQSTRTDDGSCTDFSYTITRTWTATDACGNVSDCVQTITVEDTTDPAITFCPENTTVECDQPTDPQALGEAEATDNCDGNPAITFDDVSTQTDDGSCSDFSYTITRTWTATDACGNASDCVQTITVEDTTDPVILCPEPITVQCDQSTDPSTTGEATATDVCDGNPTIDYSDESTQTDNGTCTDFSYTITRTWVAYDACGNSSDCVQPIIVVDTQAPELITCPADLTVECDVNAANTNTDPSNTGVPVAEDNCDTNISYDYDDEEVAGGPDCHDVKVITRTWKISDACGNTNVECVQTIRVRDNTPPQIVCPFDITIDCDADLDPANTGGPAIALDACDDAPAIEWVDEQTTGPCKNDSLAVITRTWFVLDLYCNAQVCDQFIVLIDKVAPEFTLCPKDTVINCDTMPIPAHTGMALVKDNCDAQPTVDFEDVSVPDPDCPQSDTIYRKWITVDHCGNINSSCMQKIVVQDTTKPVIVCPANLTVQCDESTDPAATGFPLVKDNCDAAPVISNSPLDMITPGNCPGSFVIKRTWLVADHCDNVAHCVQTITVRDTEAPTWVTEPGDLDRTVDCDDPDALADAQNLFPEATDNCDNDVTNIEKEEGDFVPGQCPHTGTYTNTWTVTDECSNISEVYTQVITVQDIVAPTFTVPADATVYSDGNCEYNADPAVTGDVTDEDDNCATVLDATYVDETADGNCAGNKIITRTWTLADGCGNALTQTQVITVQDTLIPTFPKPADMTLTTEDGATCPEIASISLTIDQTNPVATGNTPFSYTVHGISIDGPTVYSDNCSSGDNLKLFVWNIFEDWQGTADDCQRQIRILWRVYDDCGNFRQRQQIFTIVDNTAPKFTVPVDLTINCEDNPADLSLTGDVTDEYDNCHTGLEASYSDESTQTDDGSCTDYSYTITRTWTLEDGCGNSLVQTQTIEVIDLTPPTLSCPPSITISCDESTLPANTGMATADDNCDGDPDINYNDTDNQTTNGTCTDQAYRITRVWTSVDACGNQAQPCTQTIQLIDDEAPVITCPPNATVNCGDDISPTALGVATAMDNCDPAPGIANPVDFTQTAPTMCPEVKVIIRTWQAVDNCNNPTACTQRIAVVDLTAPEFDFCPKDTVINCDADYSIAALGGNATAIDDCGGQPEVTYLGETTEPTPCPQGQLITRSWEAKDDCGNTAICKQIITVQDTTRPTIVCPADVTVQCNESTDPDENPNMGVPTVSDNCDLDLATSYTETDLGGNGCTQTVLRNWITSDDCNIAAGCIQVITITDSEPPVWTFVPESVQLECDGVAPPYEAATAADDCDTDITVTFEGEVSEPGACPGSTVITRTWSTFDDCGNQTSTQQVITIQDSQPPTWTTDPLPADLTLECGETIPDPATLEAEDFCDTEISVKYAEERTDGPCPQAYKLTRTWTVEDDCGNATSHVQVITIQDTKLPVLVCPPNDLTLECGDPENADLIAVWLASAMAEDDCGNATASNNYDSANFSDGCGGTGELAVVFFAVDDCQNQSEPCTRTIRIEDNTAPVLSCPTDLTLECGNPDNAGRIDVWLTLATAQDACGDATVSHNYSPTAFSDGCGETGDQTVTFQAVDECQNNAEPCTATISIVDNMPPTLTCPQADLTLECGDPANADLITAWLAEAMATDACGDATVNNTYNPEDFSDGCGETGEQAVVFTAIDECENQSQPCTRTISIQDNTPPTLTCPQADLTLECGDAGNADLITAWLAEAMATDACGDATVNNSYNPDSFSDGCGNTGEQAVVFSAVDDCQNQSQPCTRTIRIMDTTPPTLTCPQADLTLECGDPANEDLIADWLDSAIAEDACGEVTVDHNFSPTAFSDGCGETGEQTVTFQAFDECQNSSTVCSAKIVIVDTTPPTFTVPADITLYADADCEVDYSQVGDVTDKSDNCSTDLEATFTDEAEPGPGDTERTVFRTWTLTDDCGNMTVLTQTIAIRDTTPPTFVCPQNATLAPNTDTCTHVIANQDFDPTFLADNCGIMGVGYELSGATTGSGSGSLQGVAFEVGKTTILWTVKDVNGNTATCTAIISVSVCATITGTIIWEGNNADTVGVAQVTVTLSGDDNQAVGPTPASGDYSITPAGGTNFVITPSKPGSMTTIPIDPLNGVDDLDATLIRLHIYGFLPITDPYKQIAADVDMDNKITANDEVQIRRALIGSSTALEYFAVPWRFVPDTTDTPWSLGYHPAPNPFLAPIPSTRVLTGAGSGANKQHFYGIKKGDVNATANPLLKPASIDPLVLRVQDEQLLTGKTITVVFRATNFEDLITFQHALFADPAYLQLEAVETNGSPLALNPAEHFGLSRAKAGDIRTLWLDTEGHTLADGAPLFALRFRVLQGGRLLSEVLRLHAPALEPKAYTADFARTAVELEFTEATTTAVEDPAAADKQIELLQNRPNPFTHHTVIGFVLPEACTAQLRVLDASGRELLRIDGDYPAGYNEETIQLRDIGAIGILYYELTTPYGKQTRMMKAVGP